MTIRLDQKPERDYIGGEMIDLLFGYKPIFDAEFGWIYPVGGAEGEGQTDEEKVAAEAKAAEEKAEADRIAAEEEEARKKAEEEEKVPDVRDKEIEELKAANMAHEEAEKKRKLDSLNALDRAKAEKKEADERAEAADKRSHELEIEAATHAYVARMAGEGKVLVPEFIPRIENKEDIETKFEAAWKRQEDVKKTWKSSTPNLPQGGAASPGGGGSVPQAKIDEFKKLKLLSRTGGMKNPRDIDRYSILRRELQAGGVNPALVLIA